MKRWAGVLVLLIVAAGCGDATGPELILDARVRVVHATSDAPQLRAILGTNDIGLLDYAEVTDYMQTGGGERRIQLRRADTDAVLIDTTATLEPDARYTLYAIGTAAEIRPLLLRDDVAQPDSGEALVRVVHAAPTIGDVDVYITAPTGELMTPFLTNISFTEASEYDLLPRGTYRVRITEQGTNVIAVDIPLLVLSSRRIVTIVVLDAIGGGPPHGLLVPAGL